MASNSASLTLRPLGHLLPLMTHPSPSRTAVVRVPPASEPASGSVRPKAASLRPEANSGIHVRFCSSVPKSQIGVVPRAVSYTHLRAHETRHDLVCRLLLEKKKKK